MLRLGLLLIRIHQATVKPTSTDNGNPSLQRQSLRLSPRPSQLLHGQSTGWNQHHELGRLWQELVQDLQRWADGRSWWFGLANERFIPFALQAIVKLPLTVTFTGKTTINVQIPKCLADGEYFLRVEHVALHGASSPGGAQLYISCAQLRVSGGTGMYKPNLMSFPGAYSANDPGLVVNIYYPVPTNYKAPGGAPLAC